MVTEDYLLDSLYIFKVNFYSSLIASDYGF